VSSPFLKAVVLDTQVRRLVRGGMRTGEAVRVVAIDNGVEASEVLGAIIDARHLRIEYVIA
jgi:hypothetical protein